MLGVTEFVINKFQVGSMIEARNLKEFLDQTGDYKWVEIYLVPRADGPVSKFAKIASVVA